MFSSVSAAELINETSVLYFSPEIKLISASRPGLIFAYHHFDTFPTIFKGVREIIEAQLCPF